MALWDGKIHVASGSGRCQHKNAKCAGKIKSMVGRIVLDLHIYIPTVSLFTMISEQYQVKYGQLADVEAVWMYDTAHTTQHKRCSTPKPFRFITRHGSHHPASACTILRRFLRVTDKYDRLHAIHIN